MSEHWLVDPIQQAYVKVDRPTPGGMPCTLHMGPGNLMILLARCPSKIYVVAPLLTPYTSTPTPHLLNMDWAQCSMSCSNIPFLWDPGLE